MHWQYLNASGEQIPFQDGQLQALIDAGEIRGDTRIWREDLMDWVQASELLAGMQRSPTAQFASGGHAAVDPFASDALPFAPGAAAAVPSSGESTLVRGLAGRFSAASKWMKLVSLLLFLIGLIYAVIGMVGLVSAIIGGQVLSGIIGGGLCVAIALIPIWMGILAWKGGGYAVTAAANGSRADFETSLDSTRKFFTILGVLLLVKLLLVGGLILFGVLAGGVSGLLMKSSGIGDMGSLEQPQSIDTGSLEGMMGEAGLGSAEVEQIQGMMEDMGVGGAEMQEALQQVNPEQIQDMLEGMNLEGLGIEGVDVNQIQQVLEALQGGAAAPVN